MMRKKISLVLGLFVCMLCEAQSLNPYFYYFQGEKYYLDLNTEYVSVGMENVTVAEENAELKKSVLKLDESPAGIAREVPAAWAEIDLNKVQGKDYHQKINSIKATEGVNYVAPYFTSANGNPVGLSNYLYVKLKKESDAELLRRYSAEHNVQVVKQDEFMPLWYELSCEESNLNAMECANMYYESGLFACAEPDLISIQSAAVKQSNATTINYYDFQWGMENTGQWGDPGFDIKCPNTWQYTYFERMPIIAIVDDGVQTNHPLFTYKSTFSYDAQTNTQPSKVRGNHGTAVAGIIFSKPSDKTGLRGVFPYSLLMSVSHAFGLPTSTAGFARGINAAVEAGADVINNSWSDDTPSQLLVDAINNATTNGRGGLGCVLIFAAGNEDQPEVAFPGNMDNVICVGAMTQKGYRKAKTYNWDEAWWGSNYGAGLDILAPGMFIATADRTGTDGYNPYNSLWPNTKFEDPDYYEFFNGTSAASPFVAGIAGLVLSVNPVLTWERVKTIIMNTATKLPAYTYGSRPAKTIIGNQTGWSNLPVTWNNETGAGLANAKDAVLQANWDIPYIYKDVSAGEGVDIYRVSNFPYSCKSILVEWSVSSSDYQVRPVCFSDLHAEITTVNMNAAPALLSGKITFWRNDKQITLYTVRKIIYPYGSTQKSVYRVTQNAANSVLKIVKTANEEEPAGPVSAVTANLYSNANRVLSETVPSSDTEISLDIAGLPKGNYVLNLVHGGKIILSQTVIVGR